jgi:hypothetical protein
MSKIFLILALVTLTCPAQAEIYRYLDAEGNVTFSNQPPPGVKAQPVELAPVNTVGEGGPSSSTAGATQAPGQAPEDAGYESFAITQPEDGTAVRNNAGNITISVDISPELRPSNEVYLYLDGVEVGHGAVTNLALTNVDRGTHQVHAEVKDGNGKTLAKTPSVTFTLQRVHVGGG